MRGPGRSVNRFEEVPGVQAWSLGTDTRDSESDRLTLDVCS